MRTQAPNDAIRDRGPPAAHAHSVQFFDDVAFPAERVADKLGRALTEGAAAFVFAIREHAERISLALECRGWDVDASVRDGRLVLLDVDALAQAIVHDGIADKAAFVAHVAVDVDRAVERYGRVLAYGELVNVLSGRRDFANALQLERWWNELLFAGRPVELLCGYALEPLADAAHVKTFQAICAAHAAIEPVVRDDLPNGPAAVAALQQALAALEHEESARRRAEVQRELSQQQERAARARLQFLADAGSRIAQAKLDLTRVADTLVQELMRSGFADCCAIELRTQGDTSPTVASIHRMAPDSDPPANDLPVRSTITACVRASGQDLGTLSAWRHTGTAFTPEDERLLQDLADRAALSIENALLYRRAQEERERAERERARAETANRAKDEFLAMLGHELRNPLSPILTAVQLMQLRSGGLLDKERTIIERQVNHMVRLVDDLLDISRITRGKVQLKTSLVELATVVGDAIEIASPLLEERAHRLVTDVPANLLLEADANRLAQVIANLLANAAKYTAENGTIGVTARNSGCKIVIVVRDDGAGIEPELLPHIFDLFVQGRQARDRAQGGLGLGLAIARNLVELHGGTLRAESEGPGRGSVFTIELPAAAAVCAARDTPDVVYSKRNGECRRRVLVVDDNVDAAQMLADFLGAFGHDVRVAHDGPTALEIAEPFRPELALLDIGLPVMDGHELGRRLSALLKESPPKLVAVTGYGHEADRRRSRDAGFQEHLVKPVDLERLRALIGTLFASHTAPS